MNTIQISDIAVSRNRTQDTSFARQLRRADDFTSLAVTVAEQALTALPDCKLPGRTGIFIGTACGPLATNFAALDTLLDDGEGQMSPTLFSHSVFNTAAGYISRLFAIRGPAYSLTSFCWPFLLALQEGINALDQKMVTRALVLEVETYSRVLDEAGDALKGNDTPPLEPGAVAWLLENASSAAGTPLCLVDSVQFEEKEVPPEDLLAFRSLDLALSISRSALALKDSDTERESWKAEESFGTARIELVAPFGRERENRRNTASRKLQ